MPRRMAEERSGASEASTVEAETGTGSGATEARASPAPPQPVTGTARKKGWRAGSRKMRNPGWRTVNEYPLDGDEVWELALFGGGSTAFFTIGGWLLGQYMSLSQALVATPGLPEKLIGEWQSTLWWSSRVGVACFIVGALFVAAGGYKAFRIYWSTTHQ